MLYNGGISLYVSVIDYKDIVFDGEDSTKNNTERKGTGLYPTKLHYIIKNAAAETAKYLKTLNPFVPIAHKMHFPNNEITGEYRMKGEANIFYGIIQHAVIALLLIMVITGIYNKIIFFHNYDKMQKKCWLITPRLANFTWCLIIFVLQLVFDLLDIYYLFWQEELTLQQLIVFRIQTLSIYGWITYSLLMFNFIESLFPNVVTLEYICIACAAKYRREEITYQYDQYTIILYNDNYVVMKIQKGKKYEKVLEILKQNYTLREENLEEF